MITVPGLAQLTTAFGLGRYLEPRDCFLIWGVHYIVLKKKDRFRKEHRSKRWQLIQQQMPVKTATPNDGMNFLGEKYERWLSKTSPFMCVTHRNPHLAKFLQIRKVAYVFLRERFAWVRERFAKTCVCKDFHCGMQEFTVEQQSHV